MRSAPRMVRMGRAETAHPSVLGFHVDAVAERLCESNEDAKGAVGKNLRPCSWLRHALSVDEEATSVSDDFGSALCRGS